jgi:quinol monooxygenase YgiN
LLAAFVPPDRASLDAGPCSDATVTFAVIARYVCSHEDAPEVRARLLTMREHSLREPGNLAYVVHEDVDSPHTFLLYEQYADRADFEAHTRTEHFGEHIAGFVRPRLLERTAYFSDVL